MIAVLLFSAFMGASSPLFITILENPVQGTANQTALLPVSLHFSAPLGPFFHVKWDFLSGQRPVLAYTVRKCDGSARPWGQRACHRSVQVAKEYQRRANVSLENASLVIRHVQPQDAGTYRVTVQGLDVFVTAEVNLTVTEAAPTRSGSVNAAMLGMAPTAIRLGAAGLVLCLLGLLVGEAACKPASRSPHHLAGSKEPRDELETLD